MSVPTGINVIGYASANIGLGAIVREFARALMANGHPVAMFDLDAGPGRSRLDMGMQDHFVKRMEDLPHPVNIWITGAEVLGSTAMQVCRSPFLHERFNVAFVWWELPHVPQAWALAAQVFDAVVTGSEFVREAWANHVQPTPVLMAQSPLTLPDGIEPNRARFGLPEDALLFYTGFEPASDPARKNPFAAVAAFHRAFRGVDDVRLVIKINNSGTDSRAVKQLRRLDQLVACDERVIFLRERLGYADLLSLYASCDIITSLHRAEGLALMPLEAMRLGKPVVATGWSGNMTYMTHDNACLVNSALVPTDDTSFVYSPAKIGIRSFWAEPSVDHAAAWFRALQADPALRREKGERALQGSLRYDETAAQIGFVRELDALRVQRGLLPRKDYASLLPRIQAALERQPFLHLSPHRRLLARARAAFDYRYRRHVSWRFHRTQRSQGHA